MVAVLRVMLWRGFESGVRGRRLEACLRCVVAKLIECWCLVFEEVAVAREVEASELRNRVGVYV